jgi:thiol-disulfide isomerase/thioredoxin
MKPQIVFIMAASAALLAQAPSKEALAVVATVHGRIDAQQKAMLAHIQSNKPLRAFKSILKPDIARIQVRLKKERRPDVRTALSLALCALRHADSIEMKALDPKDMEFLRTVPLESPLWGILPDGPSLLAWEVKDPAERSAFVARALDRCTVKEVRLDLLWNTFLGAYHDKRQADVTASLARLEKEFPDAKLTAQARELATIKVKVGAPAPAFRVRTLDAPDQEITLETFKGKYLLMDFWATWCGPCKAMMPTLHKVHEAFKDKGLEMLSVADDNGPEVVQAFRRKPGTPMPWHNIVNVASRKTFKRENPISDDYGIHELPTLFLIGPDGKVLALSEELHENLEGALAKFISGAAAPVDYDALRKEVTEIGTKVRAAYKAHQDAGKTEPFAVDPQELAPLRARAKAASGELKDALLVLEVFLSAQLRVPSEFQGQFLATVPPTSKGWKAAPALAGSLDQFLGKEAVPYMSAMKVDGIPEVRATLYATDAYRLATEGGDPEAVRAALDQVRKFGVDLQNVKGMVEVAEGELRTTVGKPAPDFQVQDLEHEGKTYSLGDFKGKYLLLDFWGTWCGWCVKELPNTHQVYAKLKARGLEILSLAKEAKAETVMTFRKKPEYPMPWKHGLLHDTNEHPDPALGAYGISGFPTLFLIGPDGTLLAKGGALRGEELEKTIVRCMDGTK